MNYQEYIKSALKQLKSNKARTLLTMLGMFIGVGAVIMILALGDGFKTYTTNFYEDIGLGAFYVYPNYTSNDAVITQEDIDAIRQMPEVEVVMGGFGYSGSTYNRNGEIKRVYVFGAPPEYTQYIEKITLLAGRNLTKEDEERRAHAIIVTDVFSKLILKQSNYKNVIGDTVDITVNGQPISFEIVGVYDSKMPSNVPDDYLQHALNSNHYIPYSTLDLLMGGSGDIATIYGTVKDEADPVEISANIRTLLNRRHHQKNGYNVQTAMSIIDTMNNMMDIITIFISAVASISLVVGGVGIMNIMLVTVKERTREIGVRKALGATNKAILRQFLIEALMLTVIAGLIGMVIGYLGAVVVGSMYNIPIQLTLGMLLFSAGISTLIGILFGVYPAYQAAKLDPVESLRYE